MTQFDGELSPPFEIVEPAEWRAPIIFNSPHSGSVYPDEFLNASRIDLAALRRSEDSFMDELIGDLSESRLSDGPGQLSPLLCRRQPRALRTRSADVHGPTAELRQYAIDAGGRRPRHHPARGRRRPGDLSRAAFRRRRAGADRGALQALSPRAAAADQQGASGVRNGGRGGLPFDALDRRVARRAAAAGRGDRRPLRHQLRAAAARHGRGNHARARLFGRTQQALCRRLHHRALRQSGLAGCIPSSSNSTARSTWTNGGANADRDLRRWPRISQHWPTRWPPCRSAISDRSRPRRNKVALFPVSCSFQAIYETTPHLESCHSGLALLPGMTVPGSLSRERKPAQEKRAA